MPALADGLKQLNWRQLHLQDLRISDHRLALLLKGFRKKEFSIEEEAEEIQDGINLNISPAAQLAESWDAYLDTRLSANTRQKLRRLLRRLSLDQIEIRTDRSYVPPLINFFRMRERKLAR